MKSLKFKDFLEAIGLLLLLFSFGWQCLEERLNQTKTDGYIYELNQKLEAIWAGIYDEALHSDRYFGQAAVAVNYDSLNEQFLGWEKLQEEFKAIDNQTSFSIWLRVILFFLGSICIFVAKLPKSTREI